MIKIVKRQAYLIKEETVVEQAPSVLIIDDHPLFRDALDAALERAFAGRSVSEHTGSLKDAMSALEQKSYDLVLLDLTLSDVSGFDGLAVLKSALPDKPIIIVSATETHSAFQKAKALGAMGYLPKSMTLEDLSAAIVTVLDGGLWFPADLSNTKADDLANRIASLTPAQKKVLLGLSEGLLNKQIAFEMDISIATVKAHMTAIFRKLGANNRTQALLIYREAVSLDSDPIS